MMQSKNYNFPKYTKIYKKSHLPRRCSSAYNTKLIVTKNLSGNANEKLAVAET